MKTRSIILALSFLSFIYATEKYINVFSANISIDISLDYIMYFPDDFHLTNHDYPLVLFLHGAGERGDSIHLVEKHGIPKLISKGVKFPFITIAPQCPRFQYWSEPLSVKSLSLLLDKIIEKYRIDQNRVYSTGLSMGGYGTLSLAKYRPDLFAAILPICGGMDTTEIMHLQNMPIWLFHGEKDLVVPVENSKIIYELLKPFNPEIKLTIYPDLNHNSWDETYDNEKIYKWLLSKKNR